MNPAESATGDAPDLSRYVPTESRAARLSGRPLFWVGLVGLISGLVIFRAVTSKIPDPPPVLMDLPSFSLTDQTGATFGSKDLAGKIWVANFVFTSCPTMCPELSRRMQQVRHRVRNMGSAVHLVSFSVDPERDTPEKLREYGKKYGAHPSAWSFLTGELGAVEAAVVKGFKLPMDQVAPSGVFDITHGTRFVLVDTHNRIRGYYEADDAGMDKLVHELGLLAAAELSPAR